MSRAFVYIVTNKAFGTLYIGVTMDLVRRVNEHKDKLLEGFSKRYGLGRLVYYKEFASIVEAIEYEKQLKEWNRNWKLRLIVEQNPDWKDLYDEIAVWN